RGRVESAGEAGWAPSGPSFRAHTMLTEASIRAAAVIRWVVLLPALAVACRAQTPVPAAVCTGRVVEFRVEGEALVSTPVGGVTIVAGPGLWLDVRPDGRDIVSGGEPAHLGVTDADGVFSLPHDLAPDSVAILWKPGYLPAMVLPSEWADGPLEVVLIRQPGGGGHTALARSDGRLLFGAVTAPSGETVVDSEHGVALQAPPGYMRVHVDDDYTFLRLAKGAREISVVDLKQKFDTRTLGQMLRSHTDGGEVKLLSDRRIDVDGVSATRREFRSPVGRTVLVYASRGGSYYTFILYAPEKEYDEAAAEFEAALASLCFVGRSPSAPKGFRAAKLPVWGLTYTVPPGWTAAPTREGAAVAEWSHSRLDARLVITGERSPMDSSPAATIERALAARGLAGLTLAASRPLLAGGLVGVDSTYTAEDGRMLRAAALEADGVSYCALFDLPPEPDVATRQAVTACLRSMRVP
ncbi:MAG TPA: hypothetical protein PLQ54_02190, partial [Armatimonadota bacterium]|nr:hypothetical protein [Armatimonadota bacterium]